jgi:hypothetical protein
MPYKDLNRRMDNFDPCATFLQTKQLFTSRCPAMRKESSHQTDIYAAFHPQSGLTVNWKRNDPCADIVRGLWHEGVSSMTSWVCADTEDGEAKGVVQLDRFLEERGRRYQEERWYSWPNLSHIHLNFLFSYLVEWKLYQVPCNQGYDSKWRKQTWSLTITLPLNLYARIPKVLMGWVALQTIWQNQLWQWMQICFLVVEMAHRFCTT